MRYCGCLAAFVLLFVTFRMSSQCGVNFYMFTNQYQCTTQASNVSFTINGSSGPYTCTLVNAFTNSPVASGSAAVNTGTMQTVPTGSYIVVIKTANGCTLSTSYQVHVAITASMCVIQTTNACFGGNDGRASIQAPGSFSPSFSWSIAPAVSFTPPFATGLSPGVIYTVSVTDTKGCHRTDTFSVKAKKPVVTTMSNTYVPCYGGTVLTVLSSTNGSAPYSYSVNGTAAPAQATISNNIYTVNTVDSKSCTAVTVFTVVSSPSITVGYTQRTPDCVYTSDGSMIAAASGGNGPPFSYTWHPATVSETLSSVRAGNYTITVRDGSSCATTSVLTLAPPPAISLSPVTSPENCSAADGAYTLNPSGGQSPYSSTVVNTGHTGLSQTGVPSGNYTVHTTDALGCADTTIFKINNLSTVSLSVMNSSSVTCFGKCNGSFLLSLQNAVAPVTYAVNNATVNVSGNFFQNYCAGLYRVDVLDANGCPATLTLDILSPPSITVTARTPAVGCAGNTVGIRAFAEGGNGQFSYTWLPGPLHGDSVVVSPSLTTVYSVAVTDAAGCQAPTATVQARMLDPLSILFDEGKAGVCPGSTAQITPTVTGGNGNYSYLWLPGAFTEPSLFIANAEIGEYQLTVRDGCNSTPVKKAVKVQVFPETVPLISVSESSGCAPLCVQFTNASPRSANPVWNFGTTTETAAHLASVCFTARGTYGARLSVTDSNGCKTSALYNDVVKVLESPLANFSPEPDEITDETGEVRFRNISNGANKYLWTVNNDQAGTQEDLHYTFGDTGTYRVRLLAFNGGCADTLDREIRVLEGFSLFVPDAFTPDGDGLNDVLVPRGRGWTADDYVFEIYDRWGARVYMSRTPGEGWDGGLTIVPLYTDHPSTMAGAYSWKLQVTDVTGKKHSAKGMVLLLR